MKKFLILTIDDNEDFCESLKDILESEGYSVLIAANGKLGIELANENRVDLTLVDLVMPEIDGAKTIKAIRKTKPKLPIAVVSGFSRDNTLTEAISGDIQEIFEKPVDFARLFDFINSLNLVNKS